MGLFLCFCFLLLFSASGVAKLSGFELGLVWSHWMQRFIDLFLKLLWKKQIKNRSINLCIQRSLPLSYSLFQNLVFILCSALFFLMIGVVRMIMDPFGCWESVGKQLKLRNLLNYIMKWDGLLHDSGFPFLFPMISWQANRPCSQIVL